MVTEETADALNPERKENDMDKPVIDLINSPVFITKTAAGDVARCLVDQAEDGEDTGIVFEALKAYIEEIEQLKAECDQLKSLLACAKVAMVRSVDLDPGVYQGLVSRMAEALK